MPITCVMGKFLNGELTNDCIQESGNFKILLSITDGRLGMYWIRLSQKHLCADGAAQGP